MPQIEVVVATWPDVMAVLADAPSPIDTTQITALTPMMIPSIVNPVRSLFRDNALRATR